MIPGDFLSRVLQDKRDRFTDIKAENSLSVDLSKIGPLVDSAMGSKMFELASLSALSLIVFGRPINLLTELELGSKILSAEYVEIKSFEARVSCKICSPPPLKRLLDIRVNIGEGTS